MNGSLEFDLQINLLYTIILQSFNVISQTFHTQLVLYNVRMHYLMHFVLWLCLFLLALYLYWSMLRKNLLVHMYLYVFLKTDLIEVSYDLSAVHFKCQLCVPSLNQLSNNNHVCFSLHDENIHVYGFPDCQAWI